ncbi:MAG: DJ-1/PfpI family protein [Spirochaetes bacterium]|nr:DJ-1/PfpI family protein [Spirochaetota bacterium]
MKYNLFFWLILAILFTQTFLTFSLGKRPLSKNPSKNMVLVIPNQNYRDKELAQTKELLLLNGYHITIAASSLNDAIGMNGMVIKPEVTFNKVKKNKYGALLILEFPPESLVLDQSMINDPHLFRLINHFYKKEKVIAAIGYSSIILFKSGILADKKYTGQLLDKTEIDPTHYTGFDLEKDGRIVTALDSSHIEKLIQLLMQTIEENQ